SDMYLDFSKNIVYLWDKQEQFSGNGPKYYWDAQLRASNNRFFRAGYTLNIPGGINGDKPTVSYLTISVKGSQQERGTGTCQIYKN
ncbi:MAG: hypothetical protein ACPGRD_11345, partial [Planktomarina sp.]